MHLDFQENESLPVNEGFCDHRIHPDWNVCIFMKDNLKTNKTELALFADGTTIFYSSPVKKWKSPVTANKIQIHHFHIR